MTLLRLSLRQRLLAGPLVGLVLVLVLTGTYLWHAESSNRLLVQLAEEDMGLLDRYTDLFAALSRQHMALYLLLYEAPSLEEGEIYDRGRETLDGIHSVIQDMRHLADNAAASSALNAFDEAQVAELTKALERYRASATSAVEMTSVQLNLAAGYLVEANKHFSRMHKNFAERLDGVRMQLRQQVSRHVIDNRNTLRGFALFGLLIAMVLLFFGYTSSARLSSRLQEQIRTLNTLSQSAASDEMVGDADELDRMSSAIEVFRGSLRRVGEQEQTLAAKNVELLKEIDVRIEAEQALLESKQSLEEKVSERTEDLTRSNRNLRVEIDQRKSAERRLFLYKQVIDNTDEAILITNGHGRIIDVNPAYERKLGFERDELIGQTAAKVNSGLHNKEFFARMWNSLTSGSFQWTGEIWNKTKSGQVLPFWMTINAVLDQQGRPAQYICLARDISELKQAEESLQQLAYFDPLTGLPNRAMFNDRLGQMIIAAQRHGRKLAVMFVDLDRFKDVNDTLGHSVGDALLVQVAGRLAKALRAEDTVARLGGDEFTVIVQDIRDNTNVVPIAEKIIRTLRQPFLIGEHRVQIGGSVGIALFPDHGVDAERLKKNADAAMYQAKEFGRNRFQLFDAKLLEASVQRRKLLESLRQALQQDGFTLHYQPIVELANRGVAEVESLIRWHREDGSWVSPADFIPIAEEHGMIAEIDNWVMRHACEFAARSEMPLRVHVNLSAILFQDPTTAPVVVEQLDLSGLEPERLCIEITETAVIGDPRTAREIVEQIHAHGVSFALDDFGTGYSSLTHLTRFPLQRLKIDRSFVAAMLQDEATEAVVRSMVQLAHNLGMKVVAEGVEEQSQHEHLLNMGCDYGQGWYYAKPLPEAELLVWLADRFEVARHRSSA
ncbi:MAG: EAL domain-containing protein [Chromatiales bacterium]|nr:EAL domain-containing protein [Chromatiales bacterium]